MSLQTDGTTRKLSEGPCNDAYTASLKCECSAGANLGVRASAGALAGTNASSDMGVAFGDRGGPLRKAQRAEPPPPAAALPPPPLARSPSRPCRPPLPGRLPAGLDLNKYNKSACKEAFDNYKKCKKEQASRGAWRGDASCGCPFVAPGSEAVRAAQWAACYNSLLACLPARSLRLTGRNAWPTAKASSPEAEKQE